MWELLFIKIYMTIFSILKAEHDEVKALLKKAEDTTERAEQTRKELFEKIYEALMLHAKAEQRSLYDRLHEEREFHDLLLEAEEEHHVVERSLNEIEGTHADDEHWKAKVTVLREVLEHHIKEEEEEMFPKAKKLLSAEEQKQLGEQFMKEKEAAKLEV